MTSVRDTRDSLELFELSKRYGDAVALDGLSFAVAHGSVHGFVGPNGAGKTTAMRIVLGVLGADAGEVRWGGQPVGEDDRTRFGYMPEERGLYPKMRVRDQLAYLARLHGASAADAGAAADRWIERLGLAERARDPVEALSLGNQQRVQLAAALVHEPDLLVLDEPFSGLDPVGVDVMSEVLFERARAGVPVVFSSHQLELVERVCDAVSIVAHGRLVASGTVEELRAAGDGERLRRVRVEGARDGWAETVPGVRVVERRGDELLVALADGVSEDALVDAARAAGSLRHLSAERRSLAELFREAVAA
jgi:ABC-2 type transport system ATP-binding protein